ncbi:MAG: hypothetical protein DRN40_04310 [Thermoplasmata archaeon]|nr:MAG: hypothetical protein DRN40_04310 [Thermoplasmata archaeon]
MKGWLRCVLLLSLAATLLTGQLLGSLSKQAIIGFSKAQMPIRGGDEPSLSVIFIEDVWDLQNMSQNLSAYYVLKNDINASVTRSWNNGSGFIPIGNYSSPFTGVFDGRNHTISGLFINRSSDDYVGLFGNVYGGVVRNVKLLNVTIRGKYAGGLISACSYGSVDNCSVEGEIYGGSAAGLIRWLGNGYVNYSYAVVTVKGGYECGGLIGEMYRSRVYHSYAIGNVSTTSLRVGGLVGYAHWSTISHSFAKVEVNTTYNRYARHDGIGGILGKGYRSEIISVRYEGNVTSNTTYAGGIMGYGETCSIRNSHVIGNVSGKAYVGGMIGYLYEVRGFAIKDSYMVGSVTCEREYAGGLIGFVKAWKQTGQSWVNSSYVIGDISCNGYGVGGLIGFLEGERVLGDCCVNHSYFIGNVSGVGDRVGGLIGSIEETWGRNIGGVNDSYVIGNVTGGGDYLGGLIGYGKVIWVNNTYFNGKVTGVGDNIGGLLGYGRFDWVNNSHVVGEVRGRNNVGGLLGYGRFDWVNNTFAVGEVSGRDNVGGLIGESYYKDIRNVHFNGTVKGENSSIGGIIGYGKGLLRYAYARANVEGKQDVGGLIGYGGSAIYNSHHTGNVSGIKNVGGLAGYSGRRIIASTSSGHVHGSERVGGLVGWNLGELSDFNHTGAVAGDSFVGGIVGYNDGTVSRSVFVGKVTGKDHVGGLTGINSAGSIYNTTLIVTVSGDGDYVGGITGENRNVIANSHVQGVVSGIDYVGGLVGFNYGGSASNGTFSGEIKGRSFMGGLIGFNNGPLTHVSVTGEVVGNGVYVGGMVGYNYKGTISYSTITCNVSGYNYVGCIVGINDYESKIAESTAIGNVTGRGNFAGGIAGLNLNGSITKSSFEGRVTGRNYVGGFVGGNGDRISLSFVIANVTGVDYVGGFMGNNTGEVENSYAHCHVRGHNYIGGFAGFNEKGSVSKTYTASSVSGTAYVGGFCGINTAGAIIGSFWDLNVSGESASSGGVGKTTIEMKTIATFANAEWDLTNIWCLIEGRTYPFLRWQIKDLDKEPPVADAGEDRIVNIGTEITFDGSGSTDDFGIYNYTWILRDPTKVRLYGVRPSYTFNNLGTFQVYLYVWDVAGRSDLDIVNITVADMTPPVADAGEDIVVDEDTPITFDGSGSVDNIEIVNYTWTFYDEANVTLTGVKPTYFFKNPGFYVVTLNVTDAAGNWDTDTVNVTVLDTTPPVADAGEDIEVEEDTPVTLDGSGSSDNVGIVNYTWTFKDVILIALYGVSPTYTFENPGIYTITLNVMDAAGNSDSDQIVVTVLDTTPPVADAGKDQIVAERTEVSLDGSGSSDNIGIVSYVWSFTDIIPVTLSGVRVSHLFLHPGVYVITLNVSDAAGNWDIDTVTITVRDTTPPVAKAGEDQRVPVGAMVVLNASQSTDNMAIVKYLWNISYLDNIVHLKGKVASFRFEKGGVYEVVLTVVDAEGNRGVDTLTITVIDVGEVKGVVVDESGNPVAGATVKIIASDGKTYKAITGSNGSFLLKVFHGPFTWQISKEGYKTITGTGVVEPMGEIELDLSENPLVKEKNPRGSNYLFWVLPPLTIAGILVVLIHVRKWKRKQDMNSHEKTSE